MQYRPSPIDGATDPSGKIYQRNRYYDPKTGRFTQEDPIGLAGGMNLYGFGGGDPVNFSDPFGLKACPPDCDPSLAPTLGNGCPAIADHCNVDMSRAGAIAGGAVAGGAVVVGGGLGTALWARLFPAAVAGVSARDAIGRGLVQAGGNLAKLLPEIEAQVGRVNPRNGMDALGAISKATTNVGLEVGKITEIGNGGFQILSRGGVTTNIGANGSVLIERGKDVLLNLPK